jgi:hypothetical protein
MERKEFKDEVVLDTCCSSERALGCRVDRETNDSRGGDSKMMGRTMKNSEIRLTKRKLGHQGSRISRGKIDGNIIDDDVMMVMKR